MAPHVVLLKMNFAKAGGHEKYATRIAEGFRARQATVALLTAEALRIGPLPAFLRMEIYNRRVRKWLATHAADVVLGLDRTRFQTHLRAGNGVHAAYLRSGIFSRQRTLLNQFHPLHRKILSVERCAFEHPALQKLFVNSHMVQTEILTHYNPNPACIEVIHNGVEWKEMERAFCEWPEKKAQILPSLSLDPAHFHFLFIGHGYRRKGLLQLLHAFAALKNRETHLSVLGKEKRWQYYAAVAKSLGLKGRVRFFGTVNEPRPFYQLADAVVIPSLYDPFANVTVEALAMGVFVISSRSNGGHEILTPDTGSIIHNLFEVDSIVAALEEALCHPKTQLSASHIRASVRHLDFSQQLDQLIDACIN